VAILQFLSANPMLIAQVLLYHVIAGKAMLNALSDGDQLATLLEGSNLMVAVTDGIITINGNVTGNGNASVVSADVEALNGVIHGINKVLIPQSILDILPEVDDLVGNPDDDIFQAAAATGRFTKFLSIILASGFGDALNSPGHSVSTPDLTLLESGNWSIGNFRLTLCGHFTTIIDSHFHSY
jgi:hypothetical protein